MTDWKKKHDEIEAKYRPLVVKHLALKNEMDLIKGRMKNPTMIHDRTELFKGAFEKYWARLPKIREVARLHGYAIAVHGSQRRDFDLIAAPWAWDASDVDPLVRDIVIAAEGVIQEGSPEKKPHGRLAFNIMIGGHLYIDLSVMPIKGSHLIIK